MKGSQLLWGISHRKQGAFILLCRIIVWLHAGWLTKRGNVGRDG